MTLHMVSKLNIYVLIFITGAPSTVDDTSHVDKYKKQKKLYSNSQSLHNSSSKSNQFVHHQINETENSIQRVS